MNLYLEAKNIIPEITKRIDQINDSHINQFSYLADTITDVKNGLKENTVDFIIIKVLDKNGRVYKFKTKPSFDVYVIGTFRKLFNPVQKVAEAFADYYLEYKVMPNIIAIPQPVLMENYKSVLRKITHGVLIYERR